jgi:hypothetical protein
VLQTLKADRSADPDPVYPVLGKGCLLAYSPQSYVQETMQGTSTLLVPCSGGGLMLFFDIPQLPAFLFLVMVV